MFCWWVGSLEVVQLVFHGADLGDEVGNLLLNLLSLSLLLCSCFTQLVVGTLTFTFAFTFTLYLCFLYWILLLALLSLDAADICEGMCADLDLVLGLPVLDVDAMGLSAIRHSTICQQFYCHHF